MTAAGWFNKSLYLLSFWKQATCWENASVTKTLHSKLSRLFCERIRSLREEAGMTQRDLATALNREHGMVARIELGERRVDVVEVFEVFRALGVDPEKEVSRLMADFSRLS